jgi:hypothetical protein
MKNMNDCKDAGGRAPTVGALGDAGAIAEVTKSLLCCVILILKPSNTNPSCTSCSSW